MSKCAFRYSSIVAILATALFFPRLVLATQIIEIASDANNTAATAQNVNGFFSTEFVAIITDSTIFPHVSIVGKGSAGSVNPPDFYTFTTAGSGIILDIDTTFPGGLDTEIGIWNSAGTLIGTNDNSAALDPGSTSTLNSFLRLDGLPAGTYIVGVCEGVVSSEAVDCVFGPNFSMTGNFMDSGDGYTLHISTIPEPSALILLGVGLAAIGFRRRPKKN